LSTSLFAQTRVLAISPTSGAEGSRVEISGTNLAQAIAVLFGTSPATFKVISSDKVIAIVPRWVAQDLVTVLTPQGRATSPIAFVVRNDPRVPDDVGWKGGYVNAVPPPWPFHSVLLWGIAIADPRVPGFESAKVEIASVHLSCRVDGKDVVLTDDSGSLRGGLYLRNPWFARGNFHDTLPFDYDVNHEIVILHVGERTDRVWHFWPRSARPTIPAGKFEGCSVRVRARISPGALLQVGMDYWRDAKVPWAGSDGNNHEAGASNWYLPSPEWQEATFTDIGGPFP
jgi:IPT/TIG domain-containing protein